jgi:hypothetical protein
MVNRSSFLTGTLAAVALAGCDQTPWVPPLDPMPLFPTPFLFGATLHQSQLIAAASQASGDFDCQVIRTELAYNDVISVDEGGNVKYNWYQDALYNLCVKLGVKPLFIIGYAPQPIDTNSKQPGSWYDFCWHAAMRYPLATWEVWNEWNIVQGWGAPSKPGDPQNVNAYIPVANTALAAIRTANPQAYVMTGGTSGVTAETNIYRFMVAAGLFDTVGQYGGFNALAIHPYDTDYTNIENWYSDVKGILPNGAVVWTTEFGESPIDPATMTHMAQAHKTMGVPLIWYTLVSSPDDHFGIYNSDYTPVEAAVATAKQIVNGG